MNKIIIIITILGIFLGTVYASLGQHQKSDDKIILYDRFEYAVGRDDSNAVDIFKSEGGWNQTKTETTRAGANGYIYTTDRIPGYSGPFPGSNSSRVLVLEALGGTFGAQTDFFLEYGNAYGSTETIPGNVWFQFWMYQNQYDDPNDLEDQMSGYGHYFKFIYPCKTSYPCPTENQNWLFMMGGGSFMPFNQLLGNPSQDLFMMVRESDDVSFPNIPYAGQTIGQTDLSERIVPNRWTLVKIHMDTSTSSGQFEAWLKPIGGEWVKVVDWADGQNGLRWAVANPGGHSVFRMPTTIGRASNKDLYDSWMYLDDFAMAKSEQDLPVYSH